MAALSPTSSPVVPLARAELLGLASARCEAERGLDGDEQRVGVERLLEEVQRAEARRLHRRVDGGVPAHHDDGHLVLRGADLRREELHAVAVGERDVEEAEVVGALLQLVLGDLHAAGDVDGVALERERLLERRQDRGLVVDDEEMRVRHGKEATRARTDQLGEIFRRVRP